MKKHFLASVFLFVVVAIGAALSRRNGWYDDYWFADIILHTLSGIALGWMWIGLQKEERTLSLLILGLGATSFATFGSVLWEFWEYAGWALTKTQIPFYVPTLSDTLGDIVCGMMGGVIGFITGVRKGI